MESTTKFIFKYIMAKFRYPTILMSDRGLHILNETINALIEEFYMHHQKSMLYHPQSNGIVEDFNKILENTLMKICNVNRNH